MSAIKTTRKTKTINQVSLPLVNLYNPKIAHATIKKPKPPNAKNAAIKKKSQSTSKNYHWCACGALSLAFARFAWCRLGWLTECLPKVARPIDTHKHRPTCLLLCKTYPTYSCSVRGFRQSDGFAFIKVWFYVLVVSVAALLIEEANNPILYFCSGAFVMWWLIKIKVWDMD